MAPPLPVAVVVPTHNSAAVIEACLQAARAANPAEIWVVDNGSQDATEAKVRRQGAPVRLLPQATNTGFAAASNLGWARSRAPFVLFLNDDAVLQPGYLRRTLAALQADERAASAVGKLLRPGQPARLDSAGLALHRHALRPTDRGQGELDRGQYDRPEAVFGASGAAALYRRAALAPDEAPFDASLFAYYEDVDLAWRLQRRGWRHLYVPQAQALHGRRGPDSKPLPVAARAFINRYRIFCRHESWQRFALYAPLAVPWELARLLRLGWRRPALLAKIVTTAFGDASCS